MARALLSVSDKTGLAEFGAGLAALGWELLASGGSAAALRAAGLRVTEVSDYTGSPEVLGGRVKTLHPAVHAGILARATAADTAELAAHGWSRIDLVAVNLYPFEETIRQPAAAHAAAIENIDIGGVALLRAAAKNHACVTVVCNPQDYAPVLAALQNGGSPSAALRRELAARAFARTQQYDAAIAAYLAEAEAINVQAYAVQALRYGENPHQSATLYGYTPGAGPLGGRVLQGKELSYNNLLDLDAAARAVADYPQPAVCIVKHLSPCGMAASAQLCDAVSAAIACDALSAFGGVLAANRCFDTASVLALQDLFVECIAAPEFDAAALAQLAARKNCRLLQLPPAALAARSELRSVSGGLLLQTPDLGDPPSAQWQVVSARAPSAAEHSALRFAWLACQHVKSNAIVLVRETATVGIGGGQPNRVDCVRSAIQRAGTRAQGAVLASDAFFPFPDSVALAAAAGVTAIIHPGGSMRDAETLVVANAAGMAVVQTGVRHFRH